MEPIALLSTNIIPVVPGYGPAISDDLEDCDRITRQGTSTNEVGTSNPQKATKPISINDVKELCRKGQPHDNVF